MLKIRKNCKIVKLEKNSRKNSEVPVKGNPENILDPGNFSGFLRIFKKFLVSREVENPGKRETL